MLKLKLKRKIKGLGYVILWGGLFVGFVYLSVIKGYAVPCIVGLNIGFSLWIALNLWGWIKW